ncbi:hypothetical protein [Nitrosospira multiformis]|uniref:Uncharacterized protein n=1 Tax=Nitrosospira multiformis TaxID=1231 RepID=A0A1I7I5S3_9PROT|nr:hypothetical protein [Nitrosospira multiformis]SFU68096.1 hypothetical protein SAMN05216417_11470 [Nitrosospira multiformis]
MVDSTLAGIWLAPKAYGALDAQEVTQYARAHPACLDQEAEITLAPAFVSSRRGAFATNDDALYYADHFFAADGTNKLNTDVLDVPKLQHLWSERRVALRSLIHPCEQSTMLFEDNIVPIAIDEYMCHEAGHLLGVSVQQKQLHGYFRLGGKFRWPLVYMEEFRADMNAWDLALTNLSSARARKVITYTLLHRLGLAAQNLLQGTPGAGFVPFLDFFVAWRASLIQVESLSSSPIRFDSSAHALNRLHHEIRKVGEWLTLPDLHRPELWEIAQRSMSYLNDALCTEDAVSAFRAALLPAERVAHKRTIPKNGSQHQ